MVEMGEAKIFEDRMPSEAQRTNLLARSEQLKRAIEPSVDAKAMRAVLAMLASMPAQSGEGADIQLRGEAYRMALDDMPAWAIEREATRVIRGETKLGRRFAPTPAEFREVVSDSIAPIRNEIRDIEDILRAKPIPAPTFKPRIGGSPSIERADLGRITENLLKDLAERRARREASETAGTDEAAQ